MLCDCGRRSVLRTSWTNTNPGRRFLTCDKSMVRLVICLLFCLCMGCFAEFFWDFSLNHCRMAWVVNIFNGLIHQCVIDQSKSFLVYWGEFQKMKMRTRGYKQETRSWWSGVLCLGWLQSSFICASEFGWRCFVDGRHFLRK